ncbi:MAG: ABC transporter ATP-binding protein/permease [Maledivibacter sp.]|jgi:ATP-binding cassette subfamily B protein|nr:ABC transporter ATP-binding protein/permease [Maledivibacter sp.]
MERRSESWLSVLMNYASFCKGKIIASVILSIISVLSGLIPYFAVYKILLAFIYNEIDVHTILIWSGISILGYLVKVICFGISTMLSHEGAYTILERLRMSVVNKFMHAPLGNVADKTIGEIKNMMVDRIENVEPPLAHMIPEGTGHFVLPVVVFITLLFFDWRIAFASLITIPLSMIPFSILMRGNGEKHDKYMKSANFVSSVIVEYIEGIQVVKAFGQSQNSYEKFEKAILDFKTFILDWLSSTWVPMKLTFALFPSTLLGTLPMGLFLYTKDILNPAQIFICMLLSMSMVGSLVRLEVFAEEIRQMGYVINSVKEFLDMEELPEPHEPAIIKGFEVELNNVHFGYSKDNEVLHGINLKIKEGSFTALVGPSGGGKSTVARLISRFWDVTGGNITIGGINIKSIPLSQLSNIVSFVTQDNFLFNCSILENIRLGNPKATDEEVYAAARAAQCDEFIDKLDNGYMTSAGDAGNRLSGGEKQRIAIARMILKNAPIVILDEATAFTDPENEDKIQKSISALTKGKTLLVIAHRLSTIKNANQIVVLKNGNIVQTGTQDELLENCPLYCSMWKAHIGAKVWAVGAKEAGRNV